MKRRRAIGLIAAAAAIGAGVAGYESLAQSTTMSTDRLARMRHSPNFDGKRFINPIPTENSMTVRKLYDVSRKYFAADGSLRKPAGAMPVVYGLPGHDSPRPQQGWRFWWLGHAGLLMDIDGLRILTDPVLDRRVSLNQYIGPSRLHPAPIEPEDLPEADLVILSHNHFDHLDKRTIGALATKGRRFVCPLGVGHWLERYGVAPERVTELDWWEETKIGNHTITSAPARHFSGRGLRDRDATQWASFGIKGPHTNVYFAGDSGEMPAQYAEIGKRLGPFALSFMPIGAYNTMWHDIHTDPDEALDAHKAIDGGIVMPIHWATYDLALHPWAEPVARFVERAQRDNLAYVTPKVGEMVNTANLPMEAWWLPLV